MANIAKVEPIRIDETMTELINRINADTGIIFVDTPEETRLIREMFRVFGEKDADGNAPARYKKVLFWSSAQGLHNISVDNKRNNVLADNFLPFTNEYAASEAIRDKNNKISSVGPLGNVLAIIEEQMRHRLKEKFESKNTVVESSAPSIYILRDADKYLTQPNTMRQLKDLIYLATKTNSSFILSGFGIQVPDDIAKDSRVIKMAFPTKDQINTAILPNILNKIKAFNRGKDVADQYDISIDNNTLVNACAGLTEDQIINSIYYSLKTERKICVNLINNEKKDIINKSDILEFWPGESGLNDVGGMTELKEWLEIRKIVMESPFTKDFNAKKPKGIILLGAQGSGKTHMARAIGNFFNTSITKLDMSKIFAGLVGESEKRMRQALAQIVAAGGVVVIDEIDKGLSGAGSSDKTDGGTTSRVIGTFLTWLQETHEGVFIVATANDITAIRKSFPELLRKGRFDEIWFSDIPTKEERKEIFKIHIQKNKRDPKKYDLDKLAEYVYIDAGNEYPPSGAEIEYAINDAILDAFSKGKGKQLKIGSKDDMTTDMILAKLLVINPISYVAKSVINANRKWCAKNARNVSRPRVNNIKTKETKNNIDDIDLRSIDISANDINI